MRTRSTILFFIAFAGTGGLAFAAEPGGPARRQAAVPARVPAPSLTTLASAVKAPDPDGFIQRWLILEPIPVSGALGDAAVQATVKKEYFPDQLAVIPRDGDKVTVDGTELAWHAVDTKEFNVNLLHFARAQGMRYEDVLFWAVAVINCPREMPNVRLGVGSNAASVWWVNGKEVVDVYQNRQSVVDDGVSKRLTLHKGPNVLRCAVINSTGATDFCARFLDAEEKPLTDFTISLSDAGK
jgi:hypothetical protein